MYPVRTPRLLRFPCRQANLTVVRRPLLAGKENMPPWRHVSLPASNEQTFPLTSVLAGKHF
jgi:hypothetical protein